MKNRIILALVVVVFALVLFAGCEQKTEEIQYGSITGRVLYSNGSNHSGILLTLDKTDGLRAIGSEDESKSIEGICYSKADGSYEFSDLQPGTYTVYASSDETLEKAVSSNVYVEGGKAVTVSDLKLTATGTISGKITVDSKSSGNAGFLVFVAGTSYMAATDDTGKYSISGVPTGNGYPIIASKGIYTVSLGTCNVTAQGKSTIQTMNVNSDDVLSGTIDVPGTNYANDFEYIIGDIGPAGGYIFYDCDADNETGNADGLKSSECGWRYLEAAPEDLPSGYSWGDGGFLFTSTAVGTGKSNTYKCTGNPAKACLNYTCNGYDDWFWPSKDELNLMYINLHMNVLGGFDNRGHYWSSSEDEDSSSAGYAWLQYFSNGNQISNDRDYGRGRVRPVRAF